ncbi:MAG: hypothetical protein ACE5EN_06670 [Nitrospinota bacterium]
MREKYSPVFFGIMLGFLTLLYAEFLASTFGIYEANITGALYEEALEHTAGETVKDHEKESDLPGVVFKDREEAKKVASKAWEYLMRAHIHGEGMGAIALILSLLIGHSLLKNKFKKILSIMVGFGGFAYPLCWFYAGTYMVDKGKEAARADVHILALSSVTFYLAGLGIVFVLLLLNHFFRDIPPVRFFFEKELKP